MNTKPQIDVSLLWIDFMRRGNFDAAWRLSDDLQKSRIGQSCRHLPRHLQYVWDGTPLDGKRVLVRCYHGLGDTIQFIRYLPMVKSIAKETTVLAQPRLIPLLQTLRGIDRLLSINDEIPKEEFDVEVEVMELQHVFRTTPATIPSKIPYLHAEPMELPPRNENLFVGLVWKAGDWDERRSIPFSLLAPLNEIPNVTFYILQSNARSAGWREGFGSYPGDPDIFEYARLIRALDLLISVDTMSAHLAGALGVPVWTLLHADADWRWMENCTESPWYPTMKLYRQAKQTEWKPVIASVASDLYRLAQIQK